MKRFAVAGALAMLVALAAFSQIRPERMTQDYLEASLRVQDKLQQAAAQDTIVTAQAQQEKTARDYSRNTNPAPAPAPAAAAPAPAAKDANIFRVKFETSKGSFIVEVHRDWSPLGAARFEQLVKEGFFTECRFFRALRGFMVQFGINGDPAVTKKWEGKTIPDEPLKVSNKAGMMTFAKTGLPNSRSTQFFINLVDNAYLDGSGFSPFAAVVKGQEVVKSITTEYGEVPDQFAIQEKGNEYLKQKFPNLDYIKSAAIIE